MFKTHSTWEKKKGRFQSRVFIPPWALLIGMFFINPLYAAPKNPVAIESCKNNADRKEWCLPSTNEFGKVEVGKSLTRVLTAYNFNSSTLVVGTVTLTTAVQDEFKVDNDQCSKVNLPVGGSCQITVTFNPQSVGAKTATVVIPGTSTNTSITVSLMGEGTASPPPPVLISLNITTVGQGKIISTPIGIDCNNQCQANFEQNTVVALMAEVESGWQFDSWQGDPDCQDGQVVMDREKWCEVVFVRIETTTTTPTTTEELFKQAQENGIFNNTEATLEWLKANKISLSDLTAEQRDALPITWELPKILEPPAALPVEPTSKLDEMEELLVSINRKDVVEQAEVESLNELSDELLVVAQQAEQDFQTATQAALDQKNIEPLTNFESQIKPLQKKMTTIAMLAQNIMERLQAGEMFLSQELANNMTDEELASVLGDQGLKAHAAAGMISTTRSQAISELGIPALNPDVLDFSGSCPSSSITPAPTSYLDSILDIFFPKAEAMVAVGCIATCQASFGIGCVSCLIKAGVGAGATIYSLIKKWNRCSGWWKWFCRSGIGLAIGAIVA